MIRIPKNLSTNFSKQVNSSKFIAQFHEHLTRLINQAQRRWHSRQQHQTCWLCQESFASSQSRGLFCPACEQDLPRDTNQCSQCALPLFLSKPLGNRPLKCGECLSQPPSFTHTIASFRYEFPVRELIHRMKYHKQRYWLKALAPQLIQDICNSAIYSSNPLPELLVPIPIHRSKLKQRSFNQAGLLASRLSKTLHIAMRQDILLKTEATSNQASLNKQARIHNLKKSLSINPRKGTRESINGKYIALIDDVMTTKATAELAAKCLIDAGATRVDVWCLARTPKTRNS